MQTFSRKEKEMRGVKPKDPENMSGAELFSVLYIKSPSNRALWLFVRPFQELDRTGSYHPTKRSSLYNDINAYLFVPAVQM